VPLTVEEVAALVVEAATPRQTERIALGDALDRVLAGSVASPVALPPWDNASMDGYAVRADDIAFATAGNPVELPVVGTIAAGSFAPSALAGGTAVRIMTGAPVPEGADTVVRVEDTDRGTERVAIRDARDALRNLRPRGEDIAVGQIVAEAGSLLGPAQIGVLASVGAREVDVYRRPRVALIATGDEIVDLDRFDDVIAGTRIVSSNSYSLRAAIARAGGEVVEWRLVGDDREELTRNIRDVLDSDLIVTSGGVSVGAFDYTRDGIRALGGAVLVDRVRMRPGAPLGFGTVGNALWLGLPGNPVSALVTFELFGRPLIRRLRGEHAVFPIPVPVIMDETITLAAPLTHFLRAVLTGGQRGDGAVHARLTGGQGSGILTSVARGNGLAIIRHDRLVVKPGETVGALILGNHTLVSSTFSLGP
jgi:molybdopterin molybdotransferase